MAATLGLVNRDIVFISCRDAEDNNIDILARNEQATLHHAVLAASAVDCRFFECLIAFPWATGLTGADRLPLLLAFTTDLVSATAIPRWSNFLESLGEQVDVFKDHPWQ